MRNFSAVPAQNFIGTPYTRPLKYGGIQGVGVPLNFNWIAYGASTAAPNICAIVDMRSKEVSVKLLAIRSIYIDNMGSSTPIYVYFPDTQYTVVCQPNSAGWYKAYTNELLMWVIGLGFLTGSIPATYIIVTNLTVESAIDLEIQTSIALWKASATITRGNTIYNQDFGTPALGDQFFSTQLALNAANTKTLWGTPYASGFLYITTLYISTNGFVGATVGGDDGGVASGQIVLESTGVAGILVTLNFPTGFTGPSLPLYGMQIKLDATQTWRARVVIAGTAGYSQIVSNYTTNPT